MPLPGSFIPQSVTHLYVNTPTTFQCTRSLFPGHRVPSWTPPLPPIPSLTKFFLLNTSSVSPFLLCLKLYFDHRFPDAPPAWILSPISRVNKVFPKGPGNKWLRLWRSYSLHLNYSTLSLLPKSNHKQYASKWLCSNRIFFNKKRQWVEFCLRTTVWWPPPQMTITVPRWFTKNTNRTMLFSCLNSFNTPTALRISSRVLGRTYKDLCVCPAAWPSNSYHCTFNNQWLDASQKY